MFAYNYIKLVNARKLKREITVQGYSQALSDIQIVGDKLCLNFVAQLTGQEETSLDALVAAHTTEDAVWQNIDSTLARVTDFVSTLKSEFVRENIEMGITQLGKTREVGLMLRDISFWLNQNSLYEAVAEIDLVIAKIQDVGNVEFYEVSPFITVQRMTDFKNKILAFLAS